MTCNNENCDCNDLGVIFPEGLGPKDYGMCKEQNILPVGLTVKRSYTLYLGSPTLGIGFRDDLQVFELNYQTTEEAICLQNTDLDALIREYVKRTGGV